MRERLLTPAGLTHELVKDAYRQLRFVIDTAKKQINRDKAEKEIANTFGRQGAAGLKIAMYWIDSVSLAASRSGLSLRDPDLQRYALTALEGEFALTGLPHREYLNTATEVYEQNPLLWREIAREVVTPLPE